MSNNQLQLTLDLLNRARSLIEGITTPTQSTVQSTVQPPVQLPGREHQNYTLQNLPTDRLVGELNPDHLNYSVTGSHAGTSYVGSPTTSSGSPGMSYNQNEGERASGVSVLSELRNNFSPYARPLVGSAGRPTSRRISTVSRQPAAPRATEKVVRFYCLGGPTVNLTPTQVEKTTLQMAGLGEGFVTLRSNFTVVQFQTAVCHTFPRLLLVDFTLYKATGGGGSGKHLLLLPPAGQPPIQDLMASRCPLVYIKPAQNILQNEVEDEVNVVDSDDSMDDFRSNMNVAPAHSSTPVPNRPTDNSRAGSDTTEDVSLGDCVTMLDLCEMLRSQNPGYENIAVARDDFLTHVLNIYKNPSVNFYRQPNVHFFGELGRDVGALTKEYFWNSLLALTTETVDGCKLFQGSDDEMLPSTNAFALRSGVFKAVGKLMAHSGIQTGICFIGLAHPIAQYICKSTVSSDTSLNIVPSQIGSFEVQECLEQMTHWRNGDVPDSDTLAKIHEVALESGYSGEITTAVLPNLMDHIMYYHVIDKRRAQLDEIRSGFHTTILPRYLESREYLLDIAFPPKNGFNYPTELVLGRIVCEESGAQPQYEAFKAAAYDILEDGHVTKLLCTLTGTGAFPLHNITVCLTRTDTFMIRTCFLKVEIPETFTATQVKEHLQRAVQYSSSGFGAG